MEGLFFAIGFLLGGVVGVLIMCLLQINRIGKRRIQKNEKTQRTRPVLAGQKKRRKPLTRK